MTVGYFYVHTVRFIAHHLFVPIYAQIYISKCYRIYIFQQHSFDHTTVYGFR